MSRVNPTVPSLQRAGWMPGKSRQMAHQATFSLAVLFRLIMLRQVCGDIEGFQHSTVKLLVWWCHRTRRTGPSWSCLRFSTSVWGSSRRRRSCKEPILLQIVIWGGRRSGDSSWTWDQYTAGWINLYWKQQQFCSKAVEVLNCTATVSPGAKLHLIKLLWKC